MQLFVLWKIILCINRIRLEFKAEQLQDFLIQQIVLIESDWNLKKNGNSLGRQQVVVLIESDWNLKLFSDYSSSSMSSVLIESDWNLKVVPTSKSIRWSRVLIESDWNLKWISASVYDCVQGINRIRLEFKVHSGRGYAPDSAVLIESDWNLKCFRPQLRWMDDH